MRIGPKIRLFLFARKLFLDLSPFGLRMYDTALVEREERAWSRSGWALPTSVGRENDVFTPSHHQRKGEMEHSCVGPLGSRHSSSPSPWWFERVGHTSSHSEQSR